MSWSSAIFLSVLYFGLTTCYSATLTRDGEDNSIPRPRSMVYGAASSGKPDGTAEFTNNFALNSANPMNPFLSIRPFLPLKPTFFPPVVDPNYFINEKTKMLNNLFSSGLAGSTSETVPYKASEKKTSESLLPGSPTIDPQYFINKKTEFLNGLFSQISPSDVSSFVTRANKNGPGDVPQLQRRLVPGTSSSLYPAFSPAEMIKAYTNKKTDFLNKLFDTITAPTGSTPVTDNVFDSFSPTVKPTIVPPTFWFPPYKSEGLLRDTTSVEPSAELQSIPDFQTPWGPILTPAEKADPFSSTKADFLEKLFKNIIASPNKTSDTKNTAVELGTTVKPTIVPPDFWVPAYVKSLRPVPPASAPLIPSAAIKSKFIPSIPFSPLVKGVPVVDPSIFIENKQKFLSKLFDSISIPDTLNQESGILDKAGKSTRKADLFTSSKLSSRNSEKIRIKDLEKILEMIEGNTGDDTSSNIFNERSIIPSEQPSVVTNAKDKLVENILTELANIKNNMLEATAEIVQKQKDAAAAPTYGKSSAGKKKSGPSFATPYKVWGKPTSAPTPDPLVTKLLYLNHIFDTLLQLEQDATSAINQESVQVTTEEAKSSIQTIGSKRDSNTADTYSDTSVHLMGLQLCNQDDQLPTSDLSFLDSDPTSSTPLTPEALLEKSRKIFCHLLGKVEAAKAKPQQRSIKMAVHQGYQSLPPGAEELLQAGGGSEYDNQEGGGLRLQIKVPT